MIDKKFSRRSLLLSGLGLGGISALTFNPTRELLKSVVRSIIQESRSKYLSNKLEAQEARNFVQFNFYGAPSRWAFDNVLKPSKSDPFLQAPGAYNKINSINDKFPHLSEGLYSDHFIKGFNMPHLWNYEVANSKGGTRPMADLMNNMLIIRGCNPASNAHPLSNAQQVSPVPGDFSITGLVADSTKCFIPAIGIGQTPAIRAFKSPLKTNVINIPSDEADYITYILDVFYKKNGISYRKDSDLDSEIENALGALKAYSLTNQPGADVLYHERNRAEKLIRQGVKNLDDAFGPLVAKYEELFQRSIKLSSISGVNDSIIPGINFPCEVEGDVDILSALASHHMDNYIICDPDLRDVFIKIQAENLSKHFALAEFAITEGLSSSILLSSPMERGQTLLGLKQKLTYNVNQIEKSYDPIANLTNLKIQKNAQPTSQELNLLHDSHGTGWMTNVIGCNLFYRGFSSCLLEFIDKLKGVSIAGGKTLFDETVIQYATEFERIPTKLGSGFGHNDRAHVTSLFSGIIQKPTILGNILVGRKDLSKTQKNSNAYSRVIGTIGDAAVIPSLENKIININNISSTLSEMLRVPKLVPRAVSLVEVKDSKLKVMIEDARNIEDG